MDSIQLLNPHVDVLVAGIDDPAIVAEIQNQVRLVVRAAHISGSWRIVDQPQRNVETR